MGLNPLMKRKDVYSLFLWLFKSPLVIINHYFNMLTLFIGIPLKYLQPIKINILNKSSLLKYANENFLIVHHFNFESQIICKQWSVFFVLYLNTNWVILCSWLNNWFYPVLTGYLSCAYILLFLVFFKIYIHIILKFKKKKY